MELSESIYANVWDRRLANKYVPGQDYIILRLLREMGIVSTLIDWEERGYLCHSETLDRTGLKWVGAHAGTGVQARPLDWCRPKLELLYALPVTPAGYAAAMDRSDALIGRPYDYLDCIGIALHDPSLTQYHTIICSACSFDITLHGGVTLLNVEPQFEYKVTPDILHYSSHLMGRGINAHFVA